MLGEVAGRHEGEDMGAQGFGGAVVERLGGCVLDGSVHAFGLAVGPGMTGLGEPVLDGVLVAHAVERVAHGVRLGRGVLGERGAVVGEHDADLVGDGLDDAAQERGAGCHVGGGVDLGVDDLADTIDGQDRVHFAPSGAELGTADVIVADPRLLECLAFGTGRLIRGQAGDVVAGQVAVQGVAREFGELVLEASGTSSSGRRVRRWASTMMAASASVSVVLRGLGPRRHRQWWASCATSGRFWG